MCRRARTAATLAAVCRCCALAAALALLALPARAQQTPATGPDTLPPPTPLGPAAPAVSYPTPSAPAAWVPPPAAPAPGCCGGHTLDCPADYNHWGLYVETGPFFPVGGSLGRFLDDGWTVQAGVREGRTWGRGSVFAEFAVEYTETGASGRLEETDADVFFQNGTIRTIQDFYLTRLTSFQQWGVHGALGWTYYPGLFADAPADCDPARGVFLTGRLGFRGGGTNASFDEAPTSAGLKVLKSFNTQQGNPTQDRSKFRLLDRVERNQGYYGPFATLGAGMAWPDAAVGGWSLGTVTLTAEVEVGYEATDLGQYLHEATLISVSPRLTLGFSY